MPKIVIALGSNYNQRENIQRAQVVLSEYFIKKINFTESIFTEPVGVISDKFLNCLGVTETNKTQDEVVSLLKHVEKLCGNTSELRINNIIKIDIDLLLYGNKKLHLADWNRSYIINLMNKIEVNR